MTSHEERVQIYHHPVVSRLPGNPAPATQARLTLGIPNQHTWELHLGIQVDPEMLSEGFPHKVFS